MASAGSSRNEGLAKPALSVAIAALGTFAFSGYVWLSARGGLPTPDVSAVILISIATGAAAGLISGRFLAAPASWLAAAFGSAIGYQLAYGLDSSLPAQHSSFTGNELQDWLFLMVFVGGGHLFGAWARNTDRRGFAGATIAFLGIGAWSGVGLWDLRYVEPVAGADRAPHVLLMVTVLAGIGVVAGLASGRRRDAPASLAASVIGFMVAFLIMFGIDEGVAEPMETLAYYPIAVAPFIVGGHLLGATIPTLMRRVAPRGATP